MKALLCSLLLFAGVLLTNCSIQSVSVSRPSNRFVWHPGPAIDCEHAVLYLRSVLALDEIRASSDGSFRVSYHLVGTSPYQNLDGIGAYLPIDCIRNVPVDSLEGYFPYLTNYPDVMRNFRNADPKIAAMGLAINSSTIINLYRSRDTLRLIRLPNE